MGSTPDSADWFYVGHYGQLGPLTLEQMGELCQDGVVDRETYVWKNGMAAWQMAQATPELEPFLPKLAPQMPPQAPITPPAFGATPPVQQAQTYIPPAPIVDPVPGLWGYGQGAPPTQLAAFHAPKSDKKRMVAGALNLLPGFGRFYLGYSAHGALQLMTSVFCLVGWIWSIIDGLYIMGGGVKYDGYGRELTDQ